MDFKAIFQNFKNVFSFKPRTLIVRYDTNDVKIDLLKKNDIPLIRHYQELAEGNIRYITISPELDGVQDMIPTFLRRKKLPI